MSQTATLFKPLSWHIAPWRDRSPVLLLTGSAGGGKSRLAAEKIHAYCLKYPGATALMLRKTRESAKNSIVLFMQKAVMVGTAGVKHVPSNNRFEYANGSMLIYGGMRNDDQREQVRSIGQQGGVDILWLEEAIQFTEIDFNDLLTRMRATAAPWQQVILTTNPDAPSHWIYQRLIAGGEAATYYSSALDNLYNPPAYLKILQSLTGLSKKRLVEGLWVQAEGAVYEEYDPAVHLLSKLPEGRFTFHYFMATVDWGYTNPGVILVWGIDSDGRAYLVDEVYKTGKSVESWWIPRAQELQKQYDIERFICDPAEPAFIDAFIAGGLTAEGADNEVRGGIDKVKERLKVQADLRPRLFLWAGARSDPDPVLEFKKRPTSVLDEITAYVWEPGKEKPVKENDHGMDCIRYLCNYLDRSKGILLDFV